MLGLGILTWVKIGAVLLVLAAFAWLVDDYQYQKGRVGELEAANESLAAAALANERTIRHLEAQHAASEAATRETLDRRMAEAADLASDLAALREIPDDPACPLPAAIGRALDLVREQP